MRYQKNLNNRRIIELIFLALFLIGLFYSKDFGISWDEAYHRKDAKETIAFISRLLGLDKILNIPNHVQDPNQLGYSTLFEIIFLIIEKLFSIQDIRNAYILRHALNFSIYFFSAYIFFLFIKKQIQNRTVSFIISMFYLLHPRLLGHGFFNCKDSIAQALVACAILPLYSVIKNNDRKANIISGIIIGIGIIHRMPLIYLPFICCLILFIKTLKEYKNRTHYNYVFTNISIFLIVIFFSAYILQPAFWGVSLNNVTNIFLWFKNYPVTAVNYYLGNYISATNLPWHYVPLWVFITTPLSFLFFFLLGILKTFHNMYKKSNQNLLFDTFMLLGFLIPILAIIFFNSTLYDGWRHMFFIYPFLSYFMGTGFFWTYKYIKIKYFHSRKILLVLLTLVTFYEPIFKIIKLHPNQNIYFNQLAGKDPMRYFEGDYWACSMRTGLEWILENDTSDKITIASTMNAAKINYPIIEKNNRKRLAFSRMEHQNNNTSTLKPVIWGTQSDYFITNFKWAGSDYRNLRDSTFYPYNSELFSITKDNMKILGIYKYENPPEN